MVLFALIAMVLSLVQPIIGLVCYLLIPVYYILPGHIDLHWMRNIRDRHEHKAKEHDGRAISVKSGWLLVAILL